MKSRMFLFVLTVMLAALARDVRTARAADAVVGNGTPASCTEAAFDSALATANAGGGTITFKCGANPKTIALTVIKVVNLASVTIDGGNRIILKAGNNERHFFAGSGITFQLRNITLRDGNSLVSGGAIEASGATVSLRNVQLLDNASAVTGGAIYCFDGALTIANSLLKNNTAPDLGGAIYNDGCALTISGSTFQGNQARDGGGLFNAIGGQAVLDAVTFAANTGGYGGGIENSGVVTVTNGIFDGNSVKGSGGALWNLGGTAILQRTTVSNNRAFEGGGINSYGNHLQLTDVNIVDNVATGTHGGGIYHAGGTMHSLRMPRSATIRQATQLPTAAASIRTQTITWS
ncbi:MAG: hypothetical protein IPK16_13870 [Anaerolineales bacterium]|nr:hypothetical protein [Anaerolineales bacterium]